MTRRRRSCGRTLSALACVGPLLGAPTAHADTCASLSLGALANPPGVGTNPNAVAVGDFNRDGKMDAAVVNSGSNSVSVLLGDGLGGFTPGPNSPIMTGASNPIDIAAGDLDRDGILDLVVAFGSSTQAEVLRGLGSIDAGKFTAAGQFALNASPSRIYLADFNQDADLDLVVLAETGFPARLLLYGGAAGVTFNLSALTNLDLTQSPFSPLGEQPSGAAPLDFDRDGDLDLAVVMQNLSKIWVLLGNGSGGLNPGPFTGVGATPRDVAAGDINRDGWPDLVTADSGLFSTASILFNAALGTSLSLQTPVTVGGVPTRVALADLDHDGLLDLAALDDSTTPRVSAFRGLKAGPSWFDASAAAANLSAVGLRGLGIGRFTADGRVDLVTTIDSTRQAVVIENGSGTPCAGTSFAGAPRAYPAGDAPVSTAAADFDKDGRTDLAVAVQNDRQLRLLRNVAGHFADFTPATSIDVGAATPVAVATADLNSDGNPDLVAALSNPDSIQVFRGDGMGGLITPASASALIGAAPSALVVGDFDGNGIPDVAATSESTSSVFVYLGDGLGGLASAGPPTAVGTAPRALVAGLFNADAILDLAVANSGGSNVSILPGNGNGTFGPGTPVGVGIGPQGIAAADIDGDSDTDLVTADIGSAGFGTASVLRNDSSGATPAFTLIASPAVSSPTAVALVDLDGDLDADIAVTSGAETTLRVLINATGTFGSPSDHSVRISPRAITPIDADADGLLDLAVPCRGADSVVLLLARPPGPPLLLNAPRVEVGDRPHAVVSADLDGDGDLDLAVANQAVALAADDSVSLLRNDGNANFTVYDTLAVGQDAESIVAGDFDRDGHTDLVLNVSGPTPGLSILSGSTVTPGSFSFQFSPLSPAVTGAVPDDLAAGDFDRDGDLDIAVCDKRDLPDGSVHILRNDGGAFTVASSITGVGGKPTAIVAGDLDRDGDLDLAVANEASNDIRILINDNFGGFAPAAGQPLALVGLDQTPLSITAADFDGDGQLDLAAAAFVGDRLYVYRNLGGIFAAPVLFDAPATLQFVLAADLNLDGKPDLAAVAAGLVALRGKGGLAFELPETWVARQLPWAATVGDFNRDGRPDAAVVNEASGDVSLLLSSTCLPRRLEVTGQPLTCGAGPLFGPVVVEARDDGGNLAACSTGVVKPSIAPGTGEPGADLLPDALELNGLALSNGVASFTGGTNTLSIDRAGRRFRLRFVPEDVPPLGLPPALSRSFTLGSSTIQILGPSSICAGTASYGIVDLPDRWDAYNWTLDGTPISFSPVALLSTANPLVTPGPHTLGLTTRVDGCSATAVPAKSVFVGDLQSVTLQTQGAATVCVNCIGGSAKAIESGGGTVVSREWGYRTISGGTITPIAGETGEIYVLKGASFPGPGQYFVVVTSTSSCSATAAISDEWTITVTPGVPSGEVQHLAASSRGTPAGGQNRLLWVNTAAPQEIRIRWNKAPDGTNECLPPASLTSPANNPPATDETNIMTPAPNAKSTYLHSGLVLDTAYCYSVFVQTTVGWSPGRTVKARPFDSTPGPLKWAYATGGTAVAPPTVSSEGILVLSNDHTVHALTRDSLGGDWPINWMPAELVGVAHSRSPVVPFNVPLNGADNVLFVADDSPTGVLHAINVRSGGAVWADQPQGMPVTAAPGGMFRQYNGNRDVLFVGTRHDTNPNALRALRLADGALLDVYAPAGAPGPIGPINGMPAIDYATKRVYFASRQLSSGHTLWCLEVLSDPPETPVFSYRWSRDLGDILGSPVLRGGRVYVGAESGVIYSLDALSGGDDRTFTPTPADGPVKGFLFPDRSNDDLIFATDTKVWSISDDADPMKKNWEWTVGGAGALNPSVVLLWQQMSLVYVGNKNGELYELDFTGATPAIPPTSKVVSLGGGVGQIGAPSLDIGVTPRLLLVGSEPGVLYAVEVPFPE